MFEAEIERGAKVLDRDDPGWALESAKRPINVERLDMRSPYLCILAQRDGTFLTATRRLFPGVSVLVDATLMVVHGFMLETVGDYPQLTAEWRAFIRKRRKDAKKP